MSITLFRSIASLSVVLLASCATAPAERHGGIESRIPLEVVAKERHRLIEQFVDTQAIARYDRFGVPRVEIAEGTLVPGVTEGQAALVANNAGRALCNRLGKYVEIDDSPGADVLDARLLITAIRPTGRAAAGVSSAIGFFVFFPVRLPAGLGALAGDAEVRAPDETQLAAMRWARGANFVTNGAKLSSIGDAWQLARQFGDQFAKTLVDLDSKSAGVQHARVEASMRAKNVRVCARHFGTVNLVGRGASFVLPLSPESIDPGAPGSVEADTQPQ